MSEQEHSNRQKHVIVIASPQGKVWVVGTDTQRGFTEAGALKAVARLKDSLPHGWTVWEAELYPIGEALAFNRPRVV
jgi:hypothetical protein